jgi:hypothetical protein
MFEWTVAPSITKDPRWTRRILDVLSRLVKKKSLMRLLIKLTGLNVCRMEMRTVSSTTVSLNVGPAMRGGLMTSVGPGRRLCSLANNVSVPHSAVN